jgi:hypothetical protein
MIVPMKILDADGTLRKVMSITNDVDDIGNAIAEKRLDESQRFIVLSEAYRKRFVRAEKDRLDIYLGLESERYAQGWLSRFNDDWYSPSQLAA